MDQSKERLYQIDLEDKVNKPLRDVWNYLFSKRGLEVWLETSELEKWETGINFKTKNGIQGEIRVFSPYSHIRLSWQRPDWENVSILQLRVIENNGGTEIRMHHEQLTSSAQKKEMEVHWRKILDKLNATLSQ